MSQKAEAPEARKVLKIDSLKSDLKAQREGEWQAIAELPPLRFRVRSLNYAPYKVAVDAMNRAHRREYGKKPVPDEVFAADIGAILDEHILLEWDGLDVEYTPETAHQYMVDPEMGDLRGYVLMAAGEVGVAKIEYIEAVKGN